MQTPASLILERQRESLWLLFGPVSRNTSSLSPARSRTVSESQQLKRKSTRWRGGGQRVDKRSSIFRFPSLFFFFLNLFRVPLFIRSPVVGHQLPRRCAGEAIHRITGYTNELQPWIRGSIKFAFKLHFSCATLRLFNTFPRAVENISKFDYTFRECVCVCVYTFQSIPL